MYCQVFHTNFTFWTELIVVSCFENESVPSFVVPTGQVEPSGLTTDEPEHDVTISLVPGNTPTRGEDSATTTKQQEKDKSECNKGLSSENVCQVVETSHIQDELLAKE